MLFLYGCHWFSSFNFLELSWIGLGCQSKIEYLLYPKANYTQCNHFKHLQKLSYMEPWSMKPEESMRWKDPTRPSCYPLDRACISFWHDHGWAVWSRWARGLQHIHQYFHWSHGLKLPRNLHLPLILLNQKLKFTMDHHLLFPNLHSQQLIFMIFLAIPHA